MWKSIWLSKKNNFVIFMSKGSLGFVILLLLITLGAVFYIRNPRPYKIAWASIVKDNIEHYLPCEDLPFYEQAQKALAQHQDVAERVRQIGGVTDFQPELVKCYTADKSNYFLKGDIVVDYKNHGARKAVVGTVGDNFFGIPLRGHRQ